MNYIKRSSNARKSQTSTWNGVVLEQNDVFAAMPLLLPLVYGEGDLTIQVIQALQCQ